MRGTPDDVRSSGLILPQRPGIELPQERNRILTVNRRYAPLLFQPVHAVRIVGATSGLRYRGRSTATPTERQVPAIMTRTGSRFLCEFAVVGETVGVIPDFRQ